MNIDNKNDVVVLETIHFTIEKQTLTINSIQTPHTKLHIGLNVFNFFKKFKPIFTEYPEFNAFLTQLKMFQRDHLQFNDTTVKFHNNFNFYSKISTYMQNKETDTNQGIKHFTIELIPDKRTASGRIKIDAYGYIGELNKIPVSRKQSQEHIELTTDQIKHEITNSLNVINMSNILINHSFKNPELEKYTAIISNELKNTANILNCHSSSTMLEKELITIQDFYNYIGNYLDNIDTIYNITNDGVIKFEPLTNDLLNNNYLNINPVWFKIILDNIFKNIYGHIGDTYSLLLKEFTVFYNPDLNTLCVDIINKKANVLGQNINKCHLYKKITDKYDLSIHSQIATTTRIKPSNSQGLKLIHILCEKQNISWQLLDFSDNEYIFKLIIPIYDNHNIKSCHVSNGINQIGSRSKISNLYLNEAFKETVI